MRQQGGLEQKAINLAKKNPIKDRKVIWYKFLISYYEGNVFPKSLQASYGIYERNGSTWKHSPALDTISDTPVYPQFIFEPFDMKTCNWEPKEFANVTGVTLGFAKQVKDLKGADGYSDVDSLRFRLENYLNIDNLLEQNLDLIDSSKNKRLITF